MHPEVIEALTANKDQRMYFCALTSPHYSLPLPPRKEFIYLSKTLLFATVAKETPEDHLVKRPAGLQLQSHRTVYIYTLQKLLPEELASN